MTAHERFASETESLTYLRWRNDQYFGYLELMPVHSQDGRVVLDFGCGPGHDLVGFATSSKPARLIGATSRLRHWHRRASDFRFISVPAKSSSWTRIPPS